MSNLEKITFHRLDASGNRVAGKEVSAQFNPTEITFEKSAQIAEIAIPGLDAPILQFVRGQSETLSLELFFDATEGGTAGFGLRPVTADTDRFFQLIKIDRQIHAPPILEVTWGFNQLAGSHFTDQWTSQVRSSFRCVVESVQQRFTLMSPEGTPLRATLTVKLKEYKSLEDQVEQIRFESADRTHSRVVRGGETLSGIAGEVYDDPAAWRAIALHNRIVDPADLPAGTVLEIPPLGRER